MRQPVVLTVGHSTRTFEAFRELLAAHKVKRVVDVRSIPRSRHNPQFNRETLPARLRGAGIGYVYLGKLGTAEFDTGLERLLKLAREKRCAMMCAEAGALALPSLAHRGRIARPGSFY